MEYIYAAMLIHKAGGKIDEATVKKVLEAAGVTVDDARVKALVAALDGVDIEKAIETCAIAAAPVAAAPASAGAAPAEEKAKPKEDKKPAAEAAAGLGALFG
ncbi:50S ribosomal protein P1 [Candidatus Woesearchaeota archaeon]|jgi:large subunit ribosomal protein L12|nr:50S ribosomal protein P1 [Candidatus Woesearchaeota archaeon]MBT3538312.1 50S ribosomal protein P1 [Candidatus Woesearchaeota archaeon]MBT4696694.1 50S ribosomal protein P1 [Candidatus Woesearchaeota archaeon]MBT4716812.1 50S ribosomal protein P1 [Candidatus Woesearchaeota archaeon]MBT7105981.1 50S ribosomal protein P1 [Candidatus Woesearchaeota archaeon]